MQLLQAGPCQIFYKRSSSESGCHWRVYTYPDTTIACDEMEFDDQERDTLLNPTVLVEVLSESTEKYARGRKSQHCRQIRSLKVLVLVSQEDFVVEWHTRCEDSSWLLQQRVGFAESIELEPVGIRIAMAEIYRGVSVKPGTSDKTPTA